MKVDVIKGVSHSIELIHGETSVCITPDEAENLIAQLRAVVPVPSDIQEDKAAMDYYLNLPNSSYGEGGNLLPRSINDAFKAGAEWQRERMMKEALGGMVVYVNGFATLENVVLHPADFKNGEKVNVIIIKKEK